MQSRNFTKVDFSPWCTAFHDFATVCKHKWESGLARTLFSKKIDQIVRFFVIFSNRHMARCFLHYLVILSIRLSDQNVRFRIKILRKFTVTQVFLNFEMKKRFQILLSLSVSTGGIFHVRVGILIFIHNIWCVNSVFVYNHHHVILNSHVLTVLKRTIESSGGLICWCARDMIMMFRPYLSENYWLFVIFEKYCAISSVFLIEHFVRNTYI